MLPQDIIQAARNRGQKALSEFESKQLLAAYGIPVTREAVAADAGQAVEQAEAIGWPVALKALSPELMHKSEGGFVALNLSGPEQLQQAYARMTAAPGADFHTVLVQEMVPGPRELVVGLTRDPQFGPCVMLGIGGIMTELLKDTAFRMAPFDMIEARDMTTELRGAKILSAFRGQAAADRDGLCQSLVTVGRIGLDLPDIAEIDINPMIITPDGQVKAADALIVLGGARPC